ncbi:YceI family protein [Mucilaginibacter sp. KACC 22063]|uniref:YceI family protein n=1 Tax=Mucilaginibacter sp. KACC 22063 TaxID=3025666 RepID=UPI0023651F0C|nr:YceI family protein [Mucilaginibacter sp. KACC 22063]WDF54858.1 YceI family protein [Mucilaginibacter sp. KACC 22063]
MKKFSYALLATLITVSTAFAYFAGAWKVKGDDYEVRFVGGNIKGTIKGLKTDIVFDKDHPEQAKLSASIDATTLATGFFIKTNHAKDALGADENPLIKFVSTSVTKSGNGYIATGKLTLRGTTKPAAIHFTFDDKGNDGVFKGELKVIPKDFNITRMGTPDEVMVYLNVPVTKA